MARWPRAVLVWLVETCELYGVGPHARLADTTVDLVGGYLNSQRDALLGETRHPQW